MKKSRAILEPSQNGSQIFLWDKSTVPLSHLFSFYAIITGYLIIGAWIMKSVKLFTTILFWYFFVRFFTSITIWFHAIIKLQTLRHLIVRLSLQRAILCLVCAHVIIVRLSGKLCWLVWWLIKLANVYCFWLSSRLSW